MTNDLRKAESELDEGLRLGALLWPRKMAAELRRLHEENEALRQALAQPEQEPVAVWKLEEDGWNTIADSDWMETLPVGTLLYTAPPKREWKGLTSDDKHFLLASAWNKEQAFDGFMDAIDKFLEEKNA